MVAVVVLLLYKATAQGQVMSKGTQKGEDQI